MGLLDIFKLNKIKAENELLKSKLKELKYTEYTEAKIELKKINSIVADGNITIGRLHSEISELTEKDLKLNKSVKTSIFKLFRTKELYKSVEYAIDNFFNIETPFENCKISYKDAEDYDFICPSIILQLNSMNVKDLRKAYLENNKQIEKVLIQYSDRYTTKANKAIYSLMVLALKAELQNILIELKYEKLEKAVDTIKIMANKYLVIATEGNQSIASTLTKFIGEIEYLFINAVKIEYNYYVKKEQAKQEQIVIREQMRQEAEERRALELEKKKIEQEEEKYRNEILKVNESILASKDNSEIEKLENRILQLQAQLSDVVIKKEEVINLQNGKAGTVYVISNLGSFGDNVFKIGMTRRLNPQDRVDELGSASVPFRFDVHSFIFSDDAVALEGQLHKILNNQRVNKVNRRKEFFNVSIDHLEKIVFDVQPSAEFNSTMIAEQYNQSISTKTVYEDTFVVDEELEIS